MRNDRFDTRRGWGIAVAAALLSGAVRCPAQSSESMQSVSQGATGRLSIIRTDTRESSDDLKRRGVLELEARRFEPARLLLIEALARQPQRCDIALLLAEAEQGAGATDAAVRRVAGLLASKSTDRTCLLAALNMAQRMSAWNEICAIDTAQLDVLEPDALAIYAAALERSGKSQRAADVLQSRAHAPGASPAEQAQWVRWMIDHDRSAQAWEELSRIEARGPLSAELHLLAARIYFDLDQVAGRTSDHNFPDAEPGQFRQKWLLLERKNGDRFTCSPPESAIFHLRCAEDAGLATVELWILGARIRQRLGHVRTAYETLRDHAPALIDSGDPGALDLLTELALAVHEPAEFLRLTKLRAARDPSQHDELMYRAQLALSDYYAARGDDALHLDALRRALTLKSENPELVLELADREFEAGRVETASRWYRRVLELAPWHAERRRLLERIGESATP